MTTPELDNQELNKPTDVLNADNTATGSITKKPDGTIKDDYAARDDSGVLDTSHYSTTPNTETKTTNSASGTGLDKATDLFNYSWEDNSERKSELNYKAAILESKKNYLTNRNAIEQQGNEYQNNLDMQTYSQNQSNEKAGWTGGYVLDTERQMAFLKQTIQSQMYGQMELQRYGYDTALAAARLAYDTDKYDLAMQYYQKAIENAIGEANITGYYVSPEVREHLNQYAIASRKLNDGTGTERDEQIIEAVYKWFESNGISKQGVITLAKEDYIRVLQQTAQSLANFDTNSNILKIDIDSYGEVDSEGNLLYSSDNSTVRVIDFNTLSPNKITEYAKRGHLAKQQVMGYMANLLEKDTHAYLESVKETKKVEGKETTTYNVTEAGFKEFLRTNSLVLISNIYNSDPTFFNDFKVTMDLDGKTVYVHIKDGKVDFTINQAPTNNNNGGDNGGDNGDGNYTSTDKDSQIQLENGGVILQDEEPYNIIQIDGLPAKEDKANGTATTDLKVYKLNPSTGVYDKFLYYNTANIDKVAEFLKNSGQYRDINASDTFDITKPKSEWGNKIDQQDFNAKKSKGKAGAYIDKLIEDAKAGKIPAGQEVRFNYGESAWDPYIYIHIGNGVFIKGYKNNWNYDYYIPEGYKKDGIEIKKK